MFYNNKTLSYSDTYICLLLSYSDICLLCFPVSPEFTINPENVTKIEGENVTLNCTVYGNPKPDVKWTKDEATLDISGNERLSVSNFTANTSSLTITNIVRGDEGQYRCVANNSVHTATSYPGMLRVHCKYY